MQVWLSGIKINSKTAVYFFLPVSMITFFLFGFFHLTKFETADEPLWKYGRIKQYWQAIENQDWEKTYINDKPGVTVALISGIGLLFEPDPEKNLIKDPALTQNKLFNLFNIEKTENLNLAMRLPVLILSVLSLPVFFWLIRRASNSSDLAILTTLFMVANPILVGTSQIINPDSFLWIFGGLAAFSYLALLNTREKKFLALAAVFTGFAMLSKYTSLALFLFYALSLFAKIIFDDDEKNPSGNWTSRQVCRRFLDIFVIFVISLAIFSLLLPAVFVIPEYLTKGIAHHFDAKNILFILIFAASLLLFSIWKKKYLQFLWLALRRHKDAFLFLSIFSFLGIILVVVLNAWSGQKLIPFDDIRDAAYANEPKHFDFRPILPKEDSWIKSAKIFFTEFYPFVFSLIPASLFLIVFISLKGISGKMSARSSIAVFSIFSFFILYFLANFMAEVVTNVRYSIIIYPLFAYLSAIALLEMRDAFGVRNENFVFFAGSLVLISGIWAAWNIRPFYFNYANFLLPKKFTIHHSWGHGSYEAAQFLNSLPNSKNLVVWSNTATFCPFFEGRCVYSRKIDLSLVRPDYLVISRRGELKVGKRFVYKNDSGQNEKSPDYYFEKLQNDYAWKLEIDNRPKNYVKIVEFEK